MVKMSKWYDLFRSRGVQIAMAVIVIVLIAAGCYLFRGCGPS